MVSTQLWRGDTFFIEFISIIFRNLTTTFLTTPVGFRYFQIQGKIFCMLNNHILNRFQFFSSYYRLVDLQRVSWWKANHDIFHFLFSNEACLLHKQEVSKQAETPTKLLSSPKISGNVWFCKRRDQNLHILIPYNSNSFSRGILQS